MVSKEAWTSSRHWAILETGSRPGLLALENQTKVLLATLFSSRLQGRIQSTMPAYWASDAMEILALSGSDLMRLVAQDQLALVVLLHISFLHDHVQACHVTITPCKESCDYLQHLEFLGI